MPYPGSCLCKEVELRGAPLPEGHWARLLQRHQDIYGAPHSISARIPSPNKCLRYFELGAQEGL